MDQDAVTRRDFVRHTAAAAAGAAVAGRLADQAAAAAAAAAPETEVSKTRSYHENMEYRRLGRTGLMVSAVGIGGHVKKIPFGEGSPEFKKNRREVLAACIDHGINYADPCGAGEVLFVAEALGKNREKMYLGFDWRGARDPNLAGSFSKMKVQLDTGLRQAKLEYVRPLARDHARADHRQQREGNRDRGSDAGMGEEDRQGSLHGHFNPPSTLDRGSRGQVPAVRGDRHSLYAPAARRSRWAACSTRCASTT